MPLTARCVIIAALAATACNSDVTNPASKVASVAIVSGDQQTASVGSTLPLPVVLQAMDVNGRPVRGVKIHYIVFGSLITGDPTPGDVFTDASGLAATRWSLGAEPGEKIMDGCTDVLVQPRHCVKFTAMAVQ